MKTLSCGATRRRLHAFHDCELPIGDQIAIAAHVDVCRECAAILAELQLVGSALRAGVTGHTLLSLDDAAGFQAGVVNRAKAERDASFGAWMHGVFEDMHLVYAGLGATAATMVCVVIMLGMMRFATNERPDSLAAMMAFLATPGSSANAATVDAASHARWTARFSAATEIAEEDTVLTLAAVVTRGGRIANLENLRANVGGTAHTAAAGTNDAKLIEGLLDAVSRARFEHERFEGLPSAASMVWLITHTTVRASQSPNNLDLPLPATKKRAASVPAPPPRPAIA